MENPPERAPRPNVNVAEWLSIWARAVTRPTEASYRGLFADPSPNRVTALAWLVTAGAISAAITMATWSAPIGVFAVAVICSLPIFALAYVALTVITARAALWVSRQFEGGGTPDALLYALAAVNAPMAIVSALSYLLPSGYILSYALGAYWIYLTVLAVKVVTGLSWLHALLAASAFILLSLLVIGLGVGVALLPGQ